MGFMYSVGWGSPFSGWSLSCRFQDTFVWLVKVGEKTCVSEPSRLWFLLSEPVS